MKAYEVPAQAQLLFASLGETLPEGVSNAFFSVCAKQHCGSFLYLTPDGNTLECTEVCPGDSKSAWPDLRFVGRVTKFLQRL